jgi:hypothetical protein
VEPTTAKSQGEYIAVAPSNFSNRRSTIGSSPKKFPSIVVEAPFVERNQQNVTPKVWDCGKHQYFREAACAILTPHLKLNDLEGGFC